MITGNMKKSVTLYVSSGKETGTAVQTKLTIDFSRLTVEQMQEYAVDSLVIKWRARYKNSKTKGYPKEDTYIAPVPGTRAAPAMSALDALTMIFGSEKAKEMLALAGGNAEMVIGLIKANGLKMPSSEDNEDE